MDQTILTYIFPNDSGNLNPTRKAGINMEWKRIGSVRRCAALAVIPLLVSSCLLPGCGREAASTQQLSSADYTPQKKMIEHIIAAKLPESARNCRFHSKGRMGRGTCWAYFEISRGDLPALLDSTDHLPDSSELGQDPGIKFNIEQYVEQEGESIAWWKPLTLQKRQYAQKVIGSDNVTGFFELFMLPPIDICVGEIRDNWMGVYLVYHCG
jgi:hypothetical protein